MEAFWFDSGDARVFGMLHLPPVGGKDVDTAVVICPPLGYQGVCSYRPLRVLAQALAESGRPTLRFDWPSEGDSAGSDRDPALVAGFVGAVAAAAAEVRERTGARHVALVGVTIGATLAAVAASEGADVSELVLWAPPVSGTAYLQEMRAFQRLAARRYPQTADPPPALPAGDEEANGFSMSAETVRDLGAVDLTDLRWGAHHVRRVLVAGNEPVPPDKELLDTLKSQYLEVDVARLPGVDGMLENPSTFTVPVEAFASIQAWLSAGQLAGRSRAPAGRGRSLTADGWSETVVELESLGTRLVGTLTRPATQHAGDAWVVLPSAGPVRRVGPNRLWTRFARAWAGRGVSSLRLDIRGVGDSEGPDASEEHYERLYSPEALNDIAVGIEHIRDHFDGRRFAVVGLCSGGVAGFHVAVERHDVVGAVLINPPFLVWDRDASASAHWGHVVSRLAEPRQWRRLLTGQVSTRDARGALRSGWHALGAELGRKSDTAERGLPGEDSPEDGNAVISGLERISRDGKALAFVYSHGDVGLTYLERQLGDVPGRLTNEFGASIDLVEGADHTFRPLWTHEKLQTLVEGALERAGVFELESAMEYGGSRAKSGA
jgi:alpha-beta hydrolase superfamily lysophospholipase